MSSSAAQHLGLSVKPHVMACRPIKALIFWLLMTPPSIHGDITRLKTDFTRSVEMTSHRSQSHQSVTSPGPRHQSTSSLLMETSTDADDDDTLSTPDTNNYDDDDDNDPDDYNSTLTPPSASIPTYLREEGLLSSEDYHRVSYIINIITVPVMLLGLFTNLLTIVVYLRMPKRVTSTFFSLATGLDAAFLLTGLPQTLMLLILGEEEAMRHTFYINYVLYVNSYVTNTLRKVIVCVTMMLSLDRYLMLSLPLRMKKYDDQRRPKLYTLIVALLVFLLDSNVLFKFKVVETSSSEDGADSQVYLQKTDIYMARQQMFFDISLTSSFLFQYIPLIVLVVSNILLVVALARHSRQMKHRLDTGIQGALGNGQGQTSSSEQRAIKATQSENTSVRTSANSSTRQDQGRGPDQGENQGQGQDQKWVTGQGLGRVVSPVSSQNQKWGTGQCQGRVCGAVTSSSKACQKRGVMAKGERQHSVMVLVYSFIFTLLALPNTFYPLVRKIIPGFSPLDRFHFLVLSLMDMYFLFDTISSAVNFFVCFLTGSVFRAAVFALLTTRRSSN